jgi:hypothetical protein
MRFVKAVLPAHHAANRTADPQLQLTGSHVEYSILLWQLCQALFLEIVSDSPPPRINILEQGLI